MKFLTKKRLLVFSIISTLAFLFIFYLGTTTCYRNEFCNVFRNNILHDSLIFVIIFPILLLFSFITYPLNESVFNSWKIFAVIATPIVIGLTIFLTGLDGGAGGVIGGGYVDIITPILILLYGLYFLISLIIIIRAWRQDRKNHI